IVAVFRNEVDACADAAARFAAEHPPAEALARWLQRYVDLIAAKRGLAGALSSDEPAFQSLPAYFRERVEPALQALLDAALEAGEMRPAAGADAVAAAVARLCKADARGGGPEQARRMAGLLADGRRYGARASAPERKKRGPTRQ